MDGAHAFDFPLADLSPAQQAALGAALGREGIQHQWLGSTLQVDVAYESRVSTLVDQARGGVLPVAPMPGSPGSSSSSTLSGPATVAPTPTHVAPAAPMSPTYGGTASYPAYAAYPTTGYGYQPRTASTNGLAITSLVLSILSVVFCASVLLAVPAIVCGHIAKRQIRASEGMQQGEGLATAGLIVGYAVTGITVALTVLWIVLLVVAGR